MFDYSFGIIHILLIRLYAMFVFHIAFSRLYILYTGIKCNYILSRLYHFAQITCVQPFETSSN